MLAHMDGHAPDVATFARLLERVRALPPMTQREREAQALSFSYGNFKLDEVESTGRTREAPRDVFEKLAMSHYGWTVEEFDAWASSRTWAA
jgi:hypothetical protein